MSTLHTCDKCHKEYKNRSHLSRHRKSCITDEDDKCREINLLQLKLIKFIKGN